MALQIDNVRVLFFVGFGFGITLIFVSIFGLCAGCWAGCLNKDTPDDCCGTLPLICTRVCIPIYLVLITITLIFSCLLASVFSAIYFQGAAEGCPKVLMTDQIKCLPDDTKCIEDWGPLYASNKIAAPAETSAELLSLECPLDFAVAYSTIFAPDNSTGKQSWIEIQDLFYACGYYCGTYYDPKNKAVRRGTPTGANCKEHKFFSRQMTGTFCKTKIPDEAEPLDLMVYKGEQDTLKHGQVSTAPLRDTIIGMFDDYGLPTIVLLWLVVATDIVVMVATIVLCRVVGDKKKK